MEETFVTRQRRITAVCLNEGRPPPATVADSTYPRKTFVDAAHNILFCPIQKVASTFWTRTFLAIDSRGRIESPFLIKTVNYSLLETYESFQKSRPEDFQASVMNNAISLLVVRDPYTKLFSAYTDKIYHPNHYFWRTTGKTIEDMLKRPSVPHCGHSVSFPDFIKYIIHARNETGIEIDPHFTPIYEHCDPCVSKYDYIMTFENLKAEYFYITNMFKAKFNISLTVSFEDFEKEAALKIAEEHISISFLTMKRYSKVCNIPPYSFLLRTWRFLQITGVLPKGVDIPFQNDANAGRVTKRMYLEAVTGVLSVGLDWDLLKKQRYEALVQAYQSVDKKDVNALIDIMKKDCAYFGYDDTPEYLFTNRETDNVLNYFDGLTVSKH